MRPAIYLIAFIAFIILTVFSSRAVSAGQITGISEANLDIKENADPSTWDFGQVAEGEVVKHNFIMANNSPRLIKIKGVDTSCGCTASVIAKTELQAGENTTIEVSFKSKGYSGEVRQFVYVYTDSPDTPIVKYNIKAWVLKK